MSGAARALLLLPALLLLALLLLALLPLVRLALLSLFLLGLLSLGLLSLGLLSLGLLSLGLLSLGLLSLGLRFMTMVIITGMVWAKKAFGAYWQWDPKETASLITWIIYTVYLHTRMVLGWRGRISAIAGVVGFVAVLITWLGVSYLPGLAGGLHSYASPSG